MIELPDTARSFDYENGFYLTSDKSRIGKLFAHYELFRIGLDVPGDIVECGVFKGCSLANLASMRGLFSSAEAKRIIGFDTFSAFPETALAEDKALREVFIADAGASSIAVEQLRTMLAAKGVGDNVELVAGDICETVPAYVAGRPDFRISYLHLDVDIYEPSVVVLERLWPRLSPGGVLVLDDYGMFHGETRAVDEYFAGMKTDIRTFSWAKTPAYIVKS